MAGRQAGGAGWSSCSSRMSNPIHQEPHLPTVLMQSFGPCSAPIWIQNENNRLVSVFENVCARGVHLAHAGTTNPWRVVQSWFTWRAFQWICVWLHLHSLKCAYKCTNGFLVNRWISTFLCTGKQINSVSYSWSRSPSVCWLQCFSFSPSLLACAKWFNETLESEEGQVGCVMNVDPQGQMCSAAMVGIFTV